VVGIEDNGLVGDGRSAALVTRDGSIDWLCWPRFDSPSVFGALLDPRAGSFSVRPAGEAAIARSYVPGTNVLETRFETATGTLLLTDLMTVASEEEKRRELFPEHEILREASCTRGEVVIEVRYDPRPDFGLEQARIRLEGKLGARLETRRNGSIILRSEVPLAPSPRGLTGRARLRAGERRQLSLVHAQEAPAVLRPLGERTRAAIEGSIRWWRRWLARGTYSGPYRELVERSALALKLLVYAPSGAIVAAPTTSLPERLGGDLNWDYRYTWLRDAAFTARALFGLGHHAEAFAWVSWTIHATRLTRPELRIIYDIFGERAPRERTLPRLAGFEGSRPVRVGNGAVDQLQLDVYGEVMDAAAFLVSHGGELDRETERLLEQTAEYVAAHWRLPDEGIWEVRSGRRHHTHSRLLCWVALDRALGLRREGALRKIDAGRVALERSAIRDEIEMRAWSPRRRSYASELGGERLDASLLLVPWYGFEPASSPRMCATFQRIEEELGAGPGLLYRYHRGEDSEGEGAFAICSFWAAECLALGGGTLEEAREAFEAVLPYANDLGLFGEEIDPATGAALGNFPQAYTHVGLVNTALTLEERARGEVPLQEPTTACGRRRRMAA
jgi:GH15 family glucan-1,4-alpha-glucosidase